VPRITWLSPVEIWGNTRDGGAIFLPLEELSHIASHGQATDGQDPTVLPAELHLRNGTFYVMAGPMNEWVNRIRKIRYDMLRVTMEWHEGEVPRIEEPQ
jgi:hypothetical protein